MKLITYEVLLTNGSIELVKAEEMHCPENGELLFVSYYPGGPGVVAAFAHGAWQSAVPQKEHAPKETE